MNFRLHFPGPKYNVNSVLDPTRSIPILTRYLGPDIILYED